MDRQSIYLLEMRKAGLEELAKGFTTSKLEDYERLKNSGLPVFEDFKCSYPEFNLNNSKLVSFLNRNNNVVVRGIPIIDNLPKKTHRNLSGFNNCKKFLADFIDEKNIHFYVVLMTQRAPEEFYAGAMISNDGKVVVEISKDNLDNFTHRASNPVSTGVFEHTKMLYNTEDIFEREIMWKAVQCIYSKDVFPGEDFMRGYFEFVYTKAGQLRFFDYKINESYLNLRHSMKL